MLSSDFGNLSKETEMINNSQADLFHLDIMDGRFVPNISYGFPIIKAIAEKATKPLDAHLMILSPDDYIEQFAKSGVEYLSVHYEACPHLHRTIQNIADNGMKPGVALNPHTPVSLLEEILPDLSFVLIMSVNPGFGGQKFIKSSLGKIRKLKKMIESQKTETLIEVDGGITLENAPLLIESGADILVAGNTIFSSGSPSDTIKKLKEYTLSL